jgi:hypothetical protein
MGYLNDLLSRNPLVIDGDTIRPHHKYTDDLYTGGKIIMTNYDRIKSMSVEEMAEMLIEETEAPLSGEPFLRTPDGELFNEYEETL